MTTLFIGNTTDLVLQRFRIQHRHITDLHRCQNRQNGLGFHPDSGLGLIVERTLEATGIQINSQHGCEFALWTKAFSPAAWMVSKSSL